MIILNKEGEDLVRTAEAISKFAHYGQTTKDGGPYYLHPVAVADIVDNKIHELTYKKSVAMQNFNTDVIMQNQNY